MELYIINEAGEACAPREIGELIHRGAAIYKGYWNAPEETAKRFKSIKILEKVIPLENGLNDEIVVASGDYVYKDRITSYNVCYTKLLRWSVSAKAATKQFLKRISAFWSLNSKPAAESFPRGFDVLISFSIPEDWLQYVTMKREKMKITRNNFV